MSKAFVADAHLSWHTKRFDNQSHTGGNWTELDLDFFLFIFTISNQLTTSNVSTQSRQAFTLAPTADIELPITCARLTWTCVREAEQTQKALGNTGNLLDSEAEPALQQVTMHNDDMLDVHVTVPFIRFFFFFQIKELFNRARSVVCSWWSSMTVKLHI